MSGSALLSLDDYREATLNLGTSDARLIGKHYEYDPALSRQTKRYYAGGTLLATRVIQLGCPGCEELTYVQGDHLGSTSTLTNGSGAVVARERYAAFGERRRGEDARALVTDQLYTGQRLNVLSNLYHYSDSTSPGRFYDPLLGRFVQADPVTPGSGSQALNRYAYANNAPTRYNDPNGHCPVCIPIAAGAVLGGAVSGGIYGVTHQGDSFSWGGFWGAVAAGAITGGLGVVAGPIAGTIATEVLGIAASDAAVGIGGAVVNSLASAGGYLAGGAVQNAVNSYLGDDDLFQPTPMGLAANAELGLIGGSLAAWRFPTNNLRTLEQLPYFAPRSPEGIMRGLLDPSEAPYAANLVWRGTTLSVAVGTLSTLLDYVPPAPSVVPPYGPQPVPVPTPPPWALPYQTPPPPWASLYDMP